MSSMALTESLRSNYGKGVAASSTENANADEAGGRKRRRNVET
jgi:hypothetical protein